MKTQQSSRPFPVILYVEDEESDMLLLQLAFEVAGVECQLQHVCDGEQAIDYLAGRGKFVHRESNPLPDLMLLDLNLPRQSGFDVLQWVRKQPQLKSLHVVIYTSSVNAEDCDKARRLGVDDYRLKLSDVDQIAELAKDLVQALHPQSPGKQ